MSSEPSSCNEVRRRRKSSTYSTYSEDGTELKFPRKVERKLLTFKLPNRPSLKGALAVNDILTKAEKILEGKLNGPECLVVEGDRIYTGTQDGTIVEVRDGKIHKEIRFYDGPCGTYELEPVCGRPLGLRRLNKDELIVADAYHGIFTVNFEENSFKKILDGDIVVDGKPLKFINDIEVVNEDLILFTDSSSRWSRRHFLKLVLENYPAGRVFSFVPSTGKVNVLMDKLYFPNGIQLFEDKKSFLVAETTMARILRHWISGPKKGTTEVFAENLPGLPDNVRLSTNGTFWVAVSSVRRKMQFSLFDFLGDRVLIREILLKLIPDSYWAKAYHIVRPRHAMIIQLDQSGNIISTGHDLFGATVSGISHVVDDEKYLYLGSFHANFIARVPKVIFD